MQKIKPSGFLLACLAGFLFWPASCWAEATQAGANSADTSGFGMISTFFVFALFSLFTAQWAAEKSREDIKRQPELHTLNGVQNGLAITGAYVTVATLMGIPALAVDGGQVAMVCLLGLFMGWPLIALLLSERLYHLGDYTFADFLASRFPGRLVRFFAALATLAIAFPCLAAQLLGAGLLLCFLFDFEYWLGVGIAGVLLLFYLGGKGLLAMTWLQIVKAIFLFFGVLAFAVLVFWNLDVAPDGVSEAVSRLNGMLNDEKAAEGGLAFPALAEPGVLFSLGGILFLGSLGLPFTLSRFPLTSNAKEARKSALCATGLIGMFLILMGVLCHGVARIYQEGQLLGAFPVPSGGDNLTALYLFRALGGEIVTGAFAALAAITLIAVAAKLVRVMVAAVSYDIYVWGICRGKANPHREQSLIRIMPFFLFAGAIVLAQGLAGQNLMLFVAFVFSIAASSTMPVLFMAMFWKRCTAIGLVTGGSCGLILSLAAAPFSPLLRAGEPLAGGNDPFFFTTLPGLFPVGIAFFLIWLVSLLDGSQAARAAQMDWPAHEFRMETGLSK